MEARSHWRSRGETLCGTGRRGASTPPACDAQGLAKSLIQQPGRNKHKTKYRQRRNIVLKFLNKSVTLSFPAHYLPSHPYSKFQSNEDDFYSVYGSGHTALFKTIRALRKRYPTTRASRRLASAPTQGDSDAADAKE